MEVLETLLYIAHIFVCILLILAILLQSGLGGGMGAAFGGAGAQVFGGRGAGDFLSKVTTGSAIIFFLTSLGLSIMSSSTQDSLVKSAKAKETASAIKDEPAADTETPKADGEDTSAETPKAEVEAPAKAEDAATGAPNTEAPNAEQAPKTE